MGLGGFGGAGPEAPPNVTEGAGQAPPPTGCLRTYSYFITSRLAIVQES
jgi:hypothetical protein